MPDRKQVIWDIERCICHVPDACRDCSKYTIDGAFCVEALMDDALNLLREQEPVEPAKVQRGNCTDYFCRNCTTKVGMLFSNEDAWRFHYNFCPYCGMAVKWDA